MSKNQRTANKKKVIVFGVLTLILIATWLTSQRQKTSIKDKLPSPAAKENSSQSQDSDFKLKSRLSYGNQLLLKADDNPNKQLGIKNYQRGQYKQAINNFQTSLYNYPNDPEALIYLNNSQASLNGNSHNISVSVPIGGSLDVAKEILRGVAQAQDEINQQGGLKSGSSKRLVKILIANDDNSPEIAKKIATHLVDDTKIMGVIGHNSSSSSLAAAPIYQAGNLVMISPTSVARKLSQAGDYIFRTTPSSRALAETLAKYTLDTMSRQKVAICYDSSSAASTSFNEEFSLSLSELGGIVVESSCDFASNSFSAEAAPSEAVASGAEALLVIPAVNNINQAVEVIKANANRLPLLGNHSMYTYETLNIGQENVNGLILPVPWHPSTYDSEYIQNAIKLWGMGGNWRTAMAYDATIALLNGLDKAKNRQELQQILANKGFSVQGATGKVTFTLSGDRQMPVTIVKVKSGEESGTGYDFVTLQSD